MSKSSIVKNLDLAIACVALCVLIVVTFGGVVMRDLVGSPLIWAEGVQLMCFMWMTFFGAGAAFRYGSHVAVEIVVEQLPKKIQKNIELFDLIVTVIVLCFLCKDGVKVLGLMAKMGRHTNILEIPYWFINLALPLSCVIMIASAIAAFVMKRREARAAAKAQEA